MSIHGVLGESVGYSKTYDPDILYPIARQIGRHEILKETGFDFEEGMKDDITGVDVWQAFELSWLNPLGISQVAMARLSIPASSPYIIESKSLKLYLNSLNFTKFTDNDALKTTLIKDLSACVAAEVEVQIIQLNEEGLLIAAPMGMCIDDALNREMNQITLTEDVDNTFLHGCQKSESKYYQFHSHLLRSNCPVTNQPDWGTIQIEINTSHDLDFGGILKYILSFRQHNGFHEQCVERIFADFVLCFAPTSLKVLANYTRRGGIDINPVRALHAEVGQVHRLIRQ